jgi:hypothetical protein
MEHRDRDSPRLVLRRVAVAIGAAFLALTVASVAGSQLLGSLKHWLHSQKQYATTFAAIELDPAPPAWYRGARAAFLHSVRETAQRPDLPYSSLDVDLNELDREFRLYSWVKRVRRVERKWPNRIVVHLDYRTPVARARLRTKPGLVLLDDEGVILPWEDVDPEMAARSILIDVKDIEPPFEPRMGRVWMTSEGKPDERLRAAAKLAAFLQAAVARAPEPVPPVLQPKAIHPPGNAADGPFIENNELSLIYWGDPPGSERSGSATALEKWAMLQRWLPTRPPTPVRRPYYLAFTKAEVIVARDSGRN